MTANAFFPISSRCAIQGCEGELRYEKILLLYGGEERDGYIQKCTENTKGNHTKVFCPWCNKLRKKYTKTKCDHLKMAIRSYEVAGSNAASAGPSMKEEYGSPSTVQMGTNYFDDAATAISANVSSSPSSLLGFPEEVKSMNLQPCFPMEQHMVRGHMFSTNSQQAQWTTAAAAANYYCMANPSAATTDATMWGENMFRRRREDLYNSPQTFQPNNPQVVIPTYQQQQQLLMLQYQQQQQHQQQQQQQQQSLASQNCNVFLQQAPFLQFAQQQQQQPQASGMYYVQNNWNPMAYYFLDAAGQQFTQPQPRSQEEMMALSAQNPNENTTTNTSQ